MAVDFLHVDTVLLKRLYVLVFIEHDTLCRAKTHSPSLSWCFALLRLLSGTR